MGKVRSKDGTDIVFSVSGSGPPLVLVHGTTADRNRWGPVAAPLEAKYSLHAVDRRGRGESGDNQPYAFEREFEDIAAVCDSLKDPVMLLGHSYGAICSLEASLRSRNISRLILYEPPIPTGDDIFPPGVAERIQQLVEKRDNDAAVATFFTEVVRMPAKELEMLRSLPVWKARVAAAHTIPREMRAVDGYTFDPARFRGMKVPTLLLLGGDSPAYFTRAIAAVNAALPDSRIVVLPGQQHTAMNTAPELFVKEVLGFLADRDRHDR